MANLTFNVNLNRKNIDTVFYTFARKQTVVEMVGYVKDSLIHHDGYDPDINVVCVTPVTNKEYVIQTNWGGEWCDDTTEETYKAAKEQLKCYRENGCISRIKTKRVSIFDK